MHLFGFEELAAPGNQGEGSSEVIEAEPVEEIDTVSVRTLDELKAAGK